jgi:hypothetical protein
MGIAGLEGAGGIASDVSSRFGAFRALTGFEDFEDIIIRVYNN